MTITRSYGLSNYPLGARLRIETPEARADFVHLGSDRDVSHTRLPFLSRMFGWDTANKLVVFDQAYQSRKIAEYLTAGAYRMPSVGAPEAETILVHR